MALTRSSLISSLIPCVFVGLIAVACASSKEGRRVSTEPEDAYKNSKAKAASFGIIDSFTFGTEQNVRPPNDYQFYYKKCEVGEGSTDKAFFSKTEYSCNEGP